MGRVIYRLVCAYRSIHRSLALADEHQCTLVQYHVQLVHIRKHICSRRCADTLFVIYLKNKGYLEYVNKEHLHDLGKFQFAFSVFWTYLWFSQFMLIWYANIPEETTYFRPRFEGAYSGVFYLNLTINFLAPLLIYMRASSKRNYATLTIMSVALLFGHWLDFYQMVFGSLIPDHVPMNLFDFGIAAGFVGIIMFQTGTGTGKFPLVAKNHPFFKESIIHHT